MSRILSNILIVGYLDINTFDCWDIVIVRYWNIDLFEYVVSDVLEY